MRVFPSQYKIASFDKCQLFVKIIENYAYISCISILPLTFSKYVYTETNLKKKDRKNVTFLNHCYGHALQEASVMDKKMAH